MPKLMTPHTRIYSTDTYRLEVPLEDFDTILKAWERAVLYKDNMPFRVVSLETGAVTYINFQHVTGMSQMTQEACDRANEIDAAEALGN